MTNRDLTTEVFQHCNGVTAAVALQETKADLAPVLQKQMIVRIIEASTRLTLSETYNLHDSQVVIDAHHCHPHLILHVEGVLHLMLLSDRMQYLEYWQNQYIPLLHLNTCFQLPCAEALRCDTSFAPCCEVCGRFPTCK